MDSEIWRSVPIFIPDLSASSLGRVRHGSNKPSYGSWDARQRRYTKSFVHNGKTYCFRIGRLVCLAFHGEPPPDKTYCLHLDEDARNNRPDNLRWGTQEENLNMPKFITYCQSRTGLDNPGVKGRAKSPF